ncbi:MAG: type IV pilus modification protein PilV [Marinicella sp.]
MKIFLSKNKPNLQEGFSLIEILISLVIFSFALVGVASLMTLSMRGNHNGYMRSQASILTIDIVSRMRANLAGLWEGNYNGQVVNGSTTCSAATPCTPAQLADLDKESWYRSLQQILPNSTGNIDCETHTLPPGVINAGLWVAYPPFPGVCRITISWSEINESGSEDQSVKILIQP